MLNSSDTHRLLLVRLVSLALSMTSDSTALGLSNIARSSMFWQPEWNFHTAFTFYTSNVFCYIMASVRNRQAYILELDSVCTFNCVVFKSDTESLVLWHMNNSTLFNAKSSLYIYIKYIWFGLLWFDLVWFCGISTIEGYRILNTFYTCKVLFQTIQFNISSVLYLHSLKCKISSISNNSIQCY